MSQTETHQDSEEKTKREKHREMALCDRPSAPIYRETYERKYGVDPVEEVDD